MGIFDGIKNLFAGNTTATTSGTTTNQGTSTGQTDATGNTSATATPFLQWLSSQAANRALTGQGQGDSYIQQGASGITPQQIASFANPNAQAQIAATFDPNGTLMRSQAYQRSLAAGRNSAQPQASSGRGELKDLEAQFAANNANTAAGITTAAWAPATQAALGSAGLGVQGGSALNSGLSSWLGAIPGLVGSAGGTNVGNTSQTGTSSGATSNFGTNNSTTNTQYDPSWGSILGTGASLFGSIPGFGGFMNQFNPFASYAKADGGAVKGYETGGAVKSEPSSFHGKVEDAFHTFHRMRKHAENGGVQRHGYATDGWVPTTPSYLGGPPSNDDYWNGVRAAAISNGTPPSPSPWADFGDKLSSAFDKLSQPPKDAPREVARAAPTPDYRNPAMEALGPFMGQVSQNLLTATRPRMERGGDPMGGEASTRTPFEQAWGPHSPEWNMPLPGEGDAPMRLGGPRDDGYAPRSPSAAEYLAAVGYQPRGPWEGFKDTLAAMAGNSGIPGVAGPGHGISEARRAARQENLDQAKLAGTLAESQGVVPGMGPTLLAQQFAEKQAQSRLPKWEDTFRDPLTGEMSKGWIDPWAAKREIDKINGAPPPASRPPSSAAPVAPPADSSARSPSPPPAGTQGAGYAFTNTQAAYDALPPGQPYLTPWRVDKGLGPIEKGAESQVDTSEFAWMRKHAAAPASQPASPAPSQGGVTPESRATPAAIIPSAPGVYTPHGSAPDQDLLQMTGPDLLTAMEQRHPGQAATLKSWLSGEAMPTSTFLRSPEGKRLYTLARMVDSSFSEATFPIRKRVMENFTGRGTDRQTINAAGTLVGHLDRLRELIPQLGNVNWPLSEWGRYVSNPVARAVQQGKGGYADVENQYKDTALKVAQELTKVMAGGRGGTLEEVKAALASLDPHKSEAALMGVTENAIRLMDSRLKEMTNGWNQAFAGSPREMPEPRGWLDPEHQRVINRIEGRSEGAVWPNPLGNPKYKPEPTTEGVGPKLAKPIAEMALDDLNKLHPEKLSPEQFKEAHARRKALMQGTP